MFYWEKVYIYESCVKVNYKFLVRYIKDETNVFLSLCIRAKEGGC